jgi:hypothetical protein
LVAAHQSASGFGEAGTGATVARGRAKYFGDLAVGGSATPTSLQMDRPFSEARHCGAL